MDDPWGSPWAEEEQFQQPSNRQELKGNPIATHHPAIKTPALALGGETNSPWDNDGEDDDFGDWSSVPVKADAGGVLELNGHDEKWSGGAGEHGELADHTKALAGTWRENTSLSDPPRLAPSPMPKHSVRQPSPDPWATKFSRNDTAQQLEEEGTDEEVDVPEIEERDTHAAATHKNEQTGGNPSQSGDDSESSSEDSAQEEDAGAKEDVRLNSERGTEVKRNSTAEVDRSSSRPSSSPSVGSQHEDGPHESPRTSMDDDPRGPRIPETVTPRDQEAIEHVNGHTTQEKEGAETTSRESSHVRGSQNGTDDFGDFEDSDLEETSTKEVAVKEIPEPDTSKSVEKVLSPAATPSTPKTPTTQQSITSPIRTPKHLDGPVSVDIDLSILEELFPFEKKEFVEKIFIPDTVPHDSFSSTEERKTWYRISRYGPMLKHNSGDDENYVRVAWARSTMRDDTLKIVARWMEEDRLSGQVVLGGGGRTSTLFGWGDSKAPPVSLSAAFAPKKSPTPLTLPTIPISPAALSSPQRERHDRPTRRSEELKSTPLAVANFGWNTAPGHKQVGSLQIPAPPKTSLLSTSSVTQLPSPTRTSTSSLRPIFLSETIRPVESPQRTPLSAPDAPGGGFQDFIAAKSKTSAESNIDGQDDGDEDDDEWGDMVSSPNLAITSEIHPPANEKTPIKSESAPALIPKTEPLAVSKSASNNVLVQENKSSHNPDFEDFINTPSPTVPIQNTTTSQPPSASGDSWASADFSFFDSSPAPITTTVPTPSPTLPSKPKPTKSVSFSNLTTHSTPSSEISKPLALPPPTIAQPNTKTKELAEQERLVQSILKGLPDLSYMLRK